MRCIITSRLLPPAMPQITNSATVKKMMKSKKQRKLLKTADTS